MAYIDILKQPTESKVDTLIGLSDNEIKQITPEDINKQLIININTESISEDWWTLCLERLNDETKPLPNIIFIDDYNQYYPLFSLTWDESGVSLKFTQLYNIDDDPYYYSSTYLSCSTVNIEPPTDGVCSVNISTDEADLGSIIDNWYENLNIDKQIILVPGESYNKSDVFKYVNDFTKGLKTNNIFLKLKNSLIPLSGAYLIGTTVANLYFTNIQIINGQPQTPTISLVTCRADSSTFSIGNLKSRYILPLCGYRSYFADISDSLPAGGSATLLDSDIWSATNVLTDGENVWTKVHHITQEQLDAVTAKYQEAFPDANLSTFHWVFEYNYLKTPIGDSIDNYTIAVFGNKVYRLP